MRDRNEFSFSGTVYMAQRIRCIEESRDLAPEEILDVLMLNSELKTSLSFTGEKWVLEYDGDIIGSGSLRECAVAMMNFYLQNG